MAWTAPMTAIAGSVFTAAQFNTFIRDNLAETAPAKATTPGSYFTTSATNQITERVAVEAAVNTSETTSSTTFTDLPTVGPSVTLNTGVRVFVTFAAECHSNTASESARCAVDTSGATTIGPDGNKVLREESNGTGEFQRSSVGHLITGLTPGSNTFKLMYAATGTSIASFNQRYILVFPM